MTNEQKANIVRLRYSGWGYQKISIALDISRDPIRTYCKSMGLDGYAKDLVRKQEAIQMIERINYNVGDGKSKVPQVPLEKEKAIEDALRYFKMI